MKSVCVTGAAGFLGSHLAEHYLQAGYQVIGLDNYATGMRKSIDQLKQLGGDRFFFCECDVSKPWKEWSTRIPASFLKNMEYVFHFASPASPPLYQKMPMLTLWTNSLGLNEALQFADAQRARVIYASTSEVYGDPEVSPQPETYWGQVNSFGPRSCYDESKRFGEALLYSHNREYKTGHGLVRIFNTYGPRMNPSDGRVVINFLQQAIRGEALTVYGHGMQTRSFCYVDDLIAGILSFANSKHEGPVNLGNDKEFNMLELAGEIQKLFASKKLEIKHLEMPIDDPKQRRPDIRRARELLGWSPKVALSEGLVKMKAWLEQEIGA